VIGEDVNHPFAAANLGIQSFHAVGCPQEYVISLRIGEDSRRITKADSRTAICTLVQDTITLTE
jgi:hypothetical protein